jgi:hypothetical protein
VGGGREGRGGVGAAGIKKRSGGATERAAERRSGAAERRSGACQSPRPRRPSLGRGLGRSGGSDCGPSAQDPMRSGSQGRARRLSRLGCPRQRAARAEGVRLLLLLLAGREGLATSCERTASRAAHRALLTQEQERAGRCRSAQATAHLRRAVVPLPATPPGRRWPAAAAGWLLPAKLSKSPCWSGSHGRRAARGARDSDRDPIREPPIDTSESARDYRRPGRLGHAVAAWSLAGGQGRRCAGRGRGGGTRDGTGPARARARLAAGSAAGPLDSKF